MRKKMWDIFCTVVDNFGDVGVCWRLARQLAGEHQRQVGHVRLWVDDLESFRLLCPDIDPSLDAQTQRGVEVRRWASPFPDEEPADVVIEAFACQLPESYLVAMAAKPGKPVWINLDYLSAEAWVEASHGLPSPHPRLPLTKHFFFPGFTEGTGGLLREAGLLDSRDAWQRDESGLWGQLGLPPPQSDETSISLFSYENPGMSELLDAWAAGRDPIRCLVPEGRALVQAGACLGQPAMKAGDRITRGKLTLYALPFFSQESYDHLLWACDLNFVRGEDSFVRAQWAAKPLVWHIYPQEDEAHRRKLDAFLDRYCADLSPPAAAACRGLCQAWNHGSGVAAAWPAFWQHSGRRSGQHSGELAAHARRWAEQLARREDLASGLVKFVEKLL